MRGESYKVPAHLAAQGWEELTSGFQLPRDKCVLDRFTAAQKAKGYQIMIVKSRFCIMTGRFKGRPWEYAHLLVKLCRNLKGPAKRPSKPAKPVIPPDPYQRKGVVKIGRYGEFVSSTVAGGYKVPRIATDEQGYYSGAVA